MARKPQVTRTIKVTTARVLCVDVSTEQVDTINVTVVGTFKDDTKLMRAIKKKLADEPTTKPVRIIESKVSEQLYGMSEEKFLECAELLPPRKTYGTQTNNN